MGTFDPASLIVGHAGQPATILQLPYLTASRSGRLPRWFVVHAARYSQPGTAPPLHAPLPALLELPLMDKLGEHCLAATRGSANGTTGFTSIELSEDAKDIL
jgi:hypothetical protein